MSEQNALQPAKESLGWPKRTWKRWLHEKLKQHTGLYAYPRLNRGWNLAYDMRAYAVGYTPSVFFDIGANVGQTAASYIDEFPSARYECFEPTPAVVDVLKRRFSHDKRVTVHGVAVAKEPGEARFAIDATHSTRSHLSDAQEEPNGGDSPQTIGVEVVSVDQMVERLQVDRVSLLKIDVEGFDYEVLLGAEKTLAAGRADFVQVEVGMNPQNETHVPYERVCDLMRSHGYSLFGLYDQKHEAFRCKLYLRRSDAVFVSQQMIDTYTPPDLQTV